MRTETQRKALNDTMNNVMRHGAEYAFDWFKGALHTKEDQLEHTLDKLQTLRKLFLAEVKRPLTVSEAQLCDVCRVCRGERRGPFRLDFGNEYAHDECIKS